MTRVLLPFVAAISISATSAFADTDFLNIWDLDTDGNVTWSEVEEMRKKIFETYDKDADGALNSEEYTAFDHGRAAAADQVKEPLLLRSVHGLSRSRTDLNLDGSVTRDEFRQALRTWFDGLDDNGDGYLGHGDF